MLGKRNQATNMSSSNKWKFCNTISLYHIINLSASAPIWKMACKKVNDLFTKKEDYQFQVGCVSYFNLKQNKAIKEKFDKCLSSILILKCQY